jgi:hypothetical protein
MPAEQKKTRKFGPRHATILGFVALLIFAAIFLLLQKPQTPRVIVSFLSTSNAPPREFRGLPVPTNFVLLSVTNESPRLVHCIGYLPSRYAPQVIPLQAETIPAGASAIIVIPQVQAAALYFRRQDTIAEESREMLDSVLKSIGISIPGLNPDSLANIFSIPASFPPNAGSAQN